MAMEKIKKAYLIILLTLVSILLFLIYNNKSISIEADSVVFYQMPLLFWIVLAIAPALLYFFSKDTKNQFIPIICASTYFFLFYSYGLFFLSHPTISDVESSSVTQNLLAYVSHIGVADVASNSYLNWPIFFVFSKIFSTINDLGSIQTINIGFFSLLLILSISIVYFYHMKRPKRDKNSISYFVVPSLFLLLAFNFINAQFVPQFLGLIFLFFTFSLYLKYKKKKQPVHLFLLLLFFTVCVFTHPFIFLFFPLSVLIEKTLVGLINREKMKKTFSWIMLLLMGLIVHISNFNFFIDKTKLIFSDTIQSRGEAWWVIDWIWSNRNPIGPTYELYPFYNQIPQFVDDLMASMVKIIVVSSFIILSSFLLYSFFKKEKFFELSIIGSGILWFIAGLFEALILGQRALQVVVLALTERLNKKNRWINNLSTLLIIYIVISPFLFISNEMINHSISGETFIQDFEENIAGKFIEKYHLNESVVLTSRKNLHPMKLSSLSIIYYTDMQIKDIKWNEVDLLLNSIKMKKQTVFYNITFPNSYRFFEIYDNGNAEINSNFT